MIQYLQIEEVEELHRRQLELFGGPPGYRGAEGRNLVLSALARPEFKSHNEDADLIAQAAALMYGLAKNHGFVDGNKRIAVVATDAFLQLNGFELQARKGKIHEFVSCCSSPDWTEAAVLEFVRTHTYPMA